MKRKKKLARRICREESAVDSAGVSTGVIFGRCRMRLVGRTVYPAVMEKTLFVVEETERCVQYISDSDIRGSTFRRQRTRPKTEKSRKSSFFMAILWTGGTNIGPLPDTDEAPRSGRNERLPTYCRSFSHPLYRSPFRRFNGSSKLMIHAVRHNAYS